MKDWDALENYLSFSIRNKEMAHIFIKAAAEQERNRIIKLLEKLSCPECDMNGFENDIPNRAIALIKGEHK